MRIGQASPFRTKYYGDPRCARSTQNFCSACARIQLFAMRPPIPGAGRNDKATIGNRVSQLVYDPRVGKHVEKNRFGYQRKYRYGLSPPLNSSR